MVIANDPKSLDGIEYHTPSSPQNTGKMYAMGNKRNSWRDSDRKIDTFTLPMLWKKWVIAACEPTTKNTSMSSLMPFEPSSLRLIWKSFLAYICVMQTGKVVSPPYTHPIPRLASKVATTTFNIS